MPSSFHLAATLSGEMDLLAQVAANPVDDTAKLIYADWLEERDDLRGTFLREVVEVRRAGVTSCPTLLASPPLPGSTSMSLEFRLLAPSAWVCTGTLPQRSPGRQWPSSPSPPREICPSARQNWAGVAEL